MIADGSREWLEADGLGGYASGTASTIRTRRYHGILLTATTPPTGRMLLVNGLEVWLEAAGKRFPLSSQRYAPDVIDPDGVERIVAFSTDPWPRWTYRVSADFDARLEHQLFVPAGLPITVLTWRLSAPLPGAVLVVRPLLSGRVDHALHHENPAFRFDAVVERGRIDWHPYEGVPGIVALSNGEYSAQPEWFRNFLYDEERHRGLDCAEDLASPGELRWSLSEGEAQLVLCATAPRTAALVEQPAEAVVERLRSSEQERRRAFPSRAAKAADAYLVERGTGRTVIAGYPWFTDWGRDTFISLRGLCLATGRLNEAFAILLAWADAVSEGMVPNRFPDSGTEPEYNSVDASLWYVVAIHETLAAMAAAGIYPPKPEVARLRGAIEAILKGYSSGTRFGIHRDDDGLLAAGVPGVALTWMDARVGNEPVTARSGKPVEIQALWLNALQIGSFQSARWASDLSRARKAFTESFWNDDLLCLYDVIDVDHERGRIDRSVRPNQILAVGGLPFPILTGPTARMVVDIVETRLLTPAGLRTLAPDDPRYRGQYEGDSETRDRAYHQGTVWPWLLGPFVDAWLRAHHDMPDARSVARERFLVPLHDLLDDSGTGHLPEIADGDSPHLPRGCPFQAWSVGEALRIESLLRPRSGGPR